MQPTLGELVAVTVVGLAMAWAAKKVPVLRSPLVLGAGLYTLGYYVRGRRPVGGWKALPAPAPAPAPGS